MDSATIDTTSTTSSVLQFPVAGSMAIAPVEELTPRRTKVAIVGFASSTREMAPYADESFAIWSLNHAWQFIPRWDAWFEVHPLKHIAADIVREGVVNSGNDHTKWLIAQKPGKPIYMQDHYEHIPASVMYPRDEINAWFAKRGMDIEGYFAHDYATSTISQMLMLALYQGAEEIHLYGVDLLQDDEYFYQRAGAEYLIGFARGMGIKTYIPRQSALCSANYTYGYSEPPTFSQYTSLVEYIKQQGSNAENKRNDAQAQYHTMHGALQMADVALKRLAEAGMTESDLFKLMKGERDTIAPKMQEYAKGVIALDAQRSALEACAAWTTHHARGGHLTA